MINRKVDVLLKDNTAKLKEKIFLYKDDYGVNLRFNIAKELDYYIKKENIIEANSLEGSKVIVLFVNPSGEGFYTSEGFIEEGYVSFTVTHEMTDEFRDCGEYKLQIRLIGDDYRLTIPSFTFTVSELISDTNINNNNPPIVGRAIVGNSALMASSSATLFTIEDGYIKTTWENGDIITKERLNNIEDGIANLYAKIDELSYKAIVINSFNISKSQAELGETVSGVNLSWSYSKEPKSQKLDNVDMDITLREYAYSSDITSNKTFKLEVNDGKTTVSRNVSINFYNGKYYGVSNTDVYDSDLISSLTKVLTNSKNGSFTVNAGQDEYIFFAIPARYGEPTFVNNNFEGGFAKVNTIEFTNVYGYTESYNIYRSDNPSLGNTTVDVR